MKTYYDCIPCFVRQTLEFARLITNDESVHEELLKNTLAMASELDLSKTPPEIASDFYAHIKAKTGAVDPYKELKNQFNDFALKHEKMLREQVQKSDDPIASAILISMAGNIIDLGVGLHVSEEVIQENIKNALMHELPAQTLDKFKADIEKANTILYLGDNTGEIVFDKLLVDQLPKEKIIFAVRGEPVINDATMEDAVQVGMTNLVKVIDNGSNAPGTVIDRCSREFVEVFENADVIISKGQGNYETLSEIDRNIYFVLKAKCPVIAKYIGGNVGDFVFINNSCKKIESI